MNFADGESSQTFDVTITGDDVTETAETFTVVLSNPIGATLRTGATTATVTIDDDDGAADSTPPALVALEMRDVDTDGRVDQVIARFDETLGACNASAAWTLANVPSGGSLTGVSVTGTQATLTLAEGAGAASTAVGTFTLALSGGSAGICDTSGNRASFAATPPSDVASPVLVDFSEGGGTDGRFDAGDFLQLVFSEPLQPSAVPPSNVVLTSAPSDRFTAPGVTNGAVVLVPGDYVDNNKTATFGSSAVTYLAGNTTVRLVLGACSGDCSTSSPAQINTVAAAHPVVLSAAPTFTDVVGRAAVGTVTKSVRMF